MPVYGTRSDPGSVRHASVGFGLVGQRVWAL